jgi:hypothetical protein
MFLVSIRPCGAVRRAEFNRVTICDAVSRNDSPASVILTGFVDRSSSVPAPSQISSARMCLLSADWVRKRLAAASVKLRVSHRVRKSSSHFRFMRAHAAAGECIVSRRRR